MTADVVLRHQRLYTDVWAAAPGYGDHAPGEHHVSFFLEMTQAVSGSVLDAGCGSGKGALALAARGFDVRLCDLTAEGLTPEARVLPFATTCLWHDLPTADYVYCCDVLEHIPPEYTMLACRNLLAAARQAVFLSISLVPDQFGAWVGQSLHVSVQAFTWWRDRLADLGELVECRDLGATGVYVVRPR